MPKPLETDATAALVTTALAAGVETLVIASPVVICPFATARIIVRGWAQWTNGDSTTKRTMRLRRGATTAGTLITPATAEDIITAVSKVEAGTIMGVDERGNVGTVQYAMTLELTTAGTDGALIAAGIQVEVL